LGVAVALFYVAAALAVAGALVVVLARNVVVAALGLVGALVMVGGVFLILHADFLAFAQILIYATAVSILLMFGLMLTRQSGGRARAADLLQQPLAVVAGLAVTGLGLWVAFGTPWFRPGVNPPELRPVSAADLARGLFVQWAVPFEVASVVLLVALIGAVVIARREPPVK